MSVNSYSVYLTDSFTQVDLSIGFGYEENDLLLSMRSISKEGRRYDFVRGKLKKRKLPLMFVSSLDRNIINDWWSENTKIMFVKNTEVLSCTIVNRSSPLGKVDEPYEKEFSGIIELEGY